MRLSHQWTVMLDQLQFQNYKGYHLKPYELASVEEIKQCLGGDAYGDPQTRLQHRKYMRHLIRKIEKILAGQRQMGDPSERLISELEMLRDIYSNMPI